MQMVLDSRIELSLLLSFFSSSYKSKGGFYKGRYFNSLSISNKLQQPENWSWKTRRKRSKKNFDSLCALGTTSTEHQ